VAVFVELLVLANESNFTATDISRDKIVLKALTMLTEMLRDHRAAKLRSLVLSAVGEMLCLIASQVAVLCYL